MNQDSIFSKVINGQLPLPNASKLLGWKFLRDDDQKQEVHVVFDAGSHLINLMGTIQGGFVCGMLDDSLGPAVYINLSSDQAAVTIEMNTCYVKSAYPGEIFGTGRVQHSEGAIYFTSGELTNKAGEILATATATFRVVNLR